MSPSTPRVTALAIGLMLALAAASGAALAVDSPSRAAARGAATTPAEPRATKGTSNVVAAAAPAAPVAQQQVNALEAIGAGDMVRVSVFRNPDLATEARVTDPARPVGEET